MRDVKEEDIREGKYDFYIRCRCMREIGGSRREYVLELAQAMGWKVTEEGEVVCDLCQLDRRAL